jgi:hypothetical protein
MDPYIPISEYWGGLYIVLGWVGLLWLLSQIGGWAALAKKYRLTGPADNIDWKGWQFGFFNDWFGYKGCLWIAVGSEGIYLKTGPDILFRVGHPPLLIPWSAVQSVQPTKRLWRRLLKLTLNDPQMSISLPEDLMQQARPWLPAAV